MSAPPWLYHAAPLHYLPHIVRDGALYPQSVLAARGDGIASRPTARRRDRALGLADYVHLSLRPDTPLLADKLRRGYPHALLVFDAVGVLALPGAALLPYNAKAWRPRAAFAPVTDPAEREALLRRHAGAGRFPSLEALVPYGLALAGLAEIAFFADTECDAVASVLAALALTPPAPLTTAPGLFPRCDDYAPTTGGAVAAYFARCVADGRLTPPPPIPFD